MKHKMEQKNGKLEVCTCFVANLGSREYKRSSQLEAHDASSDSTKVFSALNWLCGN